MERYEEKIGNDIRDFRAIALGLGYTKKLITNTMITTTQEVDFIYKVEKRTKNDIYLKAALYLYDNQKYYNYSI